MQLELTVKDPIVRGALALFPAFSDAPEAPHYLSGPEAEAAGFRRVSEQEAGVVVSELVVHNSGGEAGRGGAARAMSRSPRHTPGDLRRLNTRAVAESRGRGLGPRTNQGAVWDRVAAYWPGLIQGYAVDALQTPSGDATIADAETFVAQVLSAEATSEEAVGLGADLVIADDAVAEHALEWEHAVVHLAAFATSAITDRPRAGGRIDRSRWSR